MGIIIYGSKQTPIGYNEFLIKCPSCETSNWAEVMIVSSYYHMYWVPIFPYEKEANIICKKCGLRRYGRSFDSQLISNFEEVRRRYRHPWFTYIGVSLIAILIISIVIGAIM